MGNTHPQKRRALISADELRALPKRRCFSRNSGARPIRRHDAKPTSLPSHDDDFSVVDDEDTVEVFNLGEGLPHEAWSFPPEAAEGYHIGDFPTRASAERAIRTGSAPNPVFSHVARLAARAGSVRPTQPRRLVMEVGDE